MARYSEFALEKMGFTPIPDNEKIEAYFKSINVYGIQGINSDKVSPLVPDKLKRDKNGLLFSIGDSINAVCNSLLGDDFTEDEEKWKFEKKSLPPYLAVVTSLNNPAICTKGYWKHENDEIITYECFSEAKETLLKIEEKKIPTLISSLTVAFSSVDKYVLFNLISREVFAETNHGKRLRDFKLIVKGEISVLDSVTLETVSEKLDLAITILDKMNPKVGHFFDLAVREKDTLKKFLFYFFAIEKFTLNQFKVLKKEIENKSNELDLCIPPKNLPERIKKSTTEFFSRSDQKPHSILNKFIWCSIFKWKEIDDSDIDTFKCIKKIRDELSHGEIITEIGIPIRKTQFLAAKLLRTY